MENDNRQVILSNEPIVNIDKLDVKTCFDYCMYESAPLNINPPEVNNITMQFGDNKMIFKTNGEIWLNDRLLVTDEEIVEGLRKFLNIK